MELYDLTATEAHDGLVKKDFSSVELTAACLRRIDEVEDELNSFITITAESALKKARDVDKKMAEGKNLSPLEGIPTAYKDVFVTKGTETTASSASLAGFHSPYESTVTSRLNSQGVVLIGKTACDEFAQGSSGEYSAYGPTLNPRDTSRVAGGSSSGSAASIASGEVLCSLGSDTGGSVRVPVSFCGVVGLKPTYGRISRYGLIAMASSLDCPSLLSRSVRDVAQMLEVVAGFDPLDSTSNVKSVNDYVSSLDSHIEGLTIGIPKEYFVDGLDPEVKQGIEKAIGVYEDLGINISEVSLPNTEYAVAAYYIIAPSEVSSNMARYDGIRYGLFDRSGSNLEDLYKDTRSRGFGSEVKRRVILGTYTLSSGYVDQYYLKAVRVREMIRRDFEKVFDEVDIILTPTTPNVAFKLGAKSDDPLSMYLADIFTTPASLAGVPAISIPCGFNKDGLPIGMQLIAPHFEESYLLSAAYSYEKAVPRAKNSTSI